MDGAPPTFFVRPKPQNEYCQSDENFCNVDDQARSRWTALMMFGETVLDWGHGPALLDWRGGNPIPVQKTCWKL